MSRDKQIEEMAWDICDIPKHPSIKSCEQCGNKHCLAMYYAKRAYNKDYRKAKDVAREIFEEADKIFMATCLSIETYKAWCDLKKKYESEGEE